LTEKGRNSSDSAKNRLTKGQQLAEMLLEILHENYKITFQSSTFPENWSYLSNKHIIMYHFKKDFFNAKAQRCYAATNLN